MRKIYLFFITYFCFLGLALAQPANDEPAGAIDLTVNASCISATHTIVAAADSGIPSTCGFASDDDVWFKLTVPASGKFSLETSANAGSLFDYLQKVNGIYSIPILTIIVVGYLTKYVPAIAAKIGLISGCGLYIAYLLIDIFKPSVFVNLHFLDIMAILFILNVIIMLIIGKLYPRKEAFIQEYTKQVDITPWKYTKQASIVICIIVVGVYVYFA